MVDAVLLEWDGVLADTRIARQRALLEGLAEEGVASSAPMSDKFCRDYTIRAAVATALQQAGRYDMTLADLVTLRAERAFLNRLSIGGVELTAGAAAFVAHVQERSRVAIVTRASRVETELLLRLSGLELAVTAVFCADDIGGDVLCALQYRHALSQLTRVRAADPRRTIAIADGLAAIRIAREVGLRVLAIGAPAHEALEADGAAGAVTGLTMSELERMTMSPRQERSA